MSINNRLKKISYQTIKGSSIVLTDEQKIDAARSIYDAAINEAGDLPDPTGLKSIALGNVDIIWAPDGLSATFQLGSKKIQFDNLTDNIRPGITTIAGTTSVLLQPENFQKYFDESNNFNYYDISGSYLQVQPGLESILSYAIYDGENWSKSELVSENNNIIYYGTNLDFINIIGGPLFVTLSADGYETEIIRLLPAEIG